MNRKYRYGPRSHLVKKTTSYDMQTVCDRAMSIANTRKLFCPDFGLTRGYATAIEQNKLYQKGRDENGRIVYSGLVVTHCDGYINKSAHQSHNAIDIVPIDEDGNADWSDLAVMYVMTCFMEAASDLGLEIDWGGSFKSISDTCHIELINVD